MRKSKFTESQIVAILGEGEAGVPVAQSRNYALLFAGSQRAGERGCSHDIGPIGQAQWS